MTRPAAFPTGETGYETVEIKETTLFALLAGSRLFWGGFGFVMGWVVGVAVGVFVGVQLVVAW